MVVFVCGSYDVMTLLQGMETSWGDNDSGGGSSVSVAWSGNSVSWYGSSAHDQLSTSGFTYRVLALLQTD